MKRLKSGVIMNTLQIDYFLTAAEYGNITRAAEKYTISQPAMTRVIRSLEKELGVVLFEKSNRGIVLSPAGKIIYDALRETKEITDQAIKRAKEIRPEYNGQIRLSVQGGIDLYSVFYRYMNQFSVAYPDINIITESGDFYQIREQLMNRYCDAIITISASLTVRHDIETVPICKSQRMLVYSKHHPVAIRKQQPEPLDFKDTPFFGVLFNNPMAESLIERYCKGYGFIPRIISVNNIESLYANVHNTNGVGIVDQYSTELSSPHLGAIPLDSTEELVFAYHKANQSLVLRTFLTWIKEKGHWDPSVY